MIKICTFQEVMGFKFMRCIITVFFHNPAQDCGLPKNFWKPTRKNKIDKTKIFFFKFCRRDRIPFDFIFQLPYFFVHTKNEFNIFSRPLEQNRERPVVPVRKDAAVRKIFRQMIPP